MEGGSPSEPERSSRDGGSNWLPDGWTVEVKTRKGGKSKGKTYKCYVSPEGRNCYSTKQVFMTFAQEIGRKEAHENTVMKGGSPSEPERSSRDGDSNWLPDGWTVELRTQKGGKGEGKKFKCYVSPEGRNYYSKKRVLDYLKEIGMKEAHENTAFQTKGQCTTTVSGSSSVKESVELPWSIFVSVAKGLCQRKLWEADPEDERLKEKMELEEGFVHYITQHNPEEVPVGWNYNHETASNVVSRRNGDSGSELLSLSTFVEKMINKKRDTKGKRPHCCYKQTPREKRRYRAMERSHWSEHEKNLRVENLHFTTDELELKKIFENFGAVEEVYFPRDRETGHCKGFAYIEFYKLEHAKAAAQSLNGKQEVAGQTIKVFSYADHLLAEDSESKAAGLLGYDDKLKC